MTKEEALNQIHVLEEYVKSLPPEKTKEQLMEETFIELMNQGLTLKLDDGGGIIYYKGDDWVVYQKPKIKEVWFRNSLFWSVFETKFGCNYQETKKFLNGMVDKHLDCKGFATAVPLVSATPKVDKHLDCKGFATFCKYSQFMDRWINT